MNKSKSKSKSKSKIKIMIVIPVLIILAILGVIIFYGARRSTDDGNKALFIWIGCVMWASSLILLVATLFFPLLSYPPP